MSARHGDEPLALSGLNALLTTAAQNSPHGTLIEDDEGESTAIACALRVTRLAARLHSGGLVRGERVLVVAGAQTASLIAIMAVLRAGLEPVVAPCCANPVELAAYAQAAGVAALIGRSRYGSLDLSDVYLSAAALAETVRGVLTQGPDQVDGAVDVSFAALDNMSDGANLDHSPIAEMPTIATFVGWGPTLRVRSHRQASLFADALSLIGQAHINPTLRVLSLLPPASLAGLVAGPFAAFAGASRLVLHGPFLGRRFLAHCDAGSQVHLVAPSATAHVFGAPALAARLASLILASRHADQDSFVLPARTDCAIPVVDLYAFGEESVLAQPRQNGDAVAPVRPADLSLVDGLGARLNRVRAEHRIHGADMSR